MTILFHLTIPKPENPALDAVVQDAQALLEHSGGELVYVNPARRPGSRYPERLYGLHRLLHLRRNEETVALHHVFNSHLFPFPYLRWLRRPIVYTVTAGLRREKPGNLSDARRFAAIVVTNRRDQELLASWGCANTRVILPGIDTTRFSVTPPPASAKFRLLAASAPWTHEQFTSKGVDVLLEVAEQRQDLRLVFLWRGLLYEEMLRRVADRGLHDRVQVINRQIDVAAELMRAHAAIVLTADPSLVKAFPHSLMEALAAGRPVLLSRALPMADHVAQTGCGTIVETVDADALLVALDALRRGYSEFQSSASAVGQRDFGQARMVSAYQALYADVSAQVTPGVESD
jgi:glycosyltransferase involved in cell wall biosynthesis